MKIQFYYYKQYIIKIQIQFFFIKIHLKQETYNSGY